MFTISNPWPTSYQSYHYQSHKPTPLSTIHHNVQLFAPMSPAAEHSKNRTTSKTPSFRTASTKPRQLASVKSPNERRQLRNAVLLKNIKDRRQNARDDLRSEHILRSEILAEQRAWEQAQEDEAAKWSTSVEDMDDQLDDPELEDLIRREEEELQARAMEQMQAENTVNLEGYSSENDDFDMLFLEAMEEYERSRQGDQGMDFS